MSKKKRIKKLKNNVDTLVKRVGALTNALIECQLRFGEYRDSHAAKGTEEGNQKARHNAEMVHMIDQVLG